MSTPLLTTKLHIPAPRPNLVPRPSLIRRLDEGLHLGHRLTLLSAPVGFGKTTLLGEWIGTSHVPAVVASISLDEGDNDPARFLAYLVAALQGASPEIGRGLPSPLPLRRVQLSEPLLTSLLNDITAIPELVLLVLDDYHVIRSEAIHQALTFLLDHLPLPPGGMHLVIASRSDPPLPLARLRGRGELTELRQPDLRFTRDEVGQFLRRSVDLQLEEEDITALATRTEGWAAALQMIAVSLRDRADISAFVQTLTGSDRHIQDYLVEEVLNQQPAETQAFLLQTAILDRMAGPLCDAVLELAGDGEHADGEPPTTPVSSPSQRYLEQLESNNLFVVPLDSERRWYRYHHLFADLLRQRLARMMPEQLASLHRRASAWHERAGQRDAAIHHALQARDGERASRLVEEAAESVMLRSQVATLSHWLDTLPDELVAARPLLSVYHAVTMLLSGRPLEVVEARLRDAELADNTGEARGELAAVRALIAVYQGQARHSAELSQRALELLPEENLFFRSLIAGQLSLSYLYAGQVRAATQALSEAYRIGQKMGNLMVTVLAQCHLGDLAAVQGQLRQARRLYLQALESATDSQGRRQPIAGLAVMGLGLLAYELNDLEMASRHLQEGIELITRWGQVGAIQGYVGLARVRQAEGDEEGASQAMQKAQQVAATFDAMQSDDIYVAHHRATLWIRQGRIDRAEEWAASRGLGEDVSPGELMDALEYLALARLRLAQKQPERALAILEPLLATAEAAGWEGIVARILICMALALWQAKPGRLPAPTSRVGEPPPALTTLGRALALVEPQGYVRIFLDEGQPMEELLRHAASWGIQASFAARLLAAFAPTEDGAERTPTPLPQLQPLVEPLSERELEVLRLLSTDLSTREIGDRLFIAYSTIRSHAKSIYGKLNVHSRREAVRRAQELGLL